jgi:hypothetical protein
MCGNFFLQAPDSAARVAETIERFAGENAGVGAMKIILLTKLKYNIVVWPYSDA